METRNNAARMPRNPNQLCRLNKNLRAFGEVQFRAGDGVLLMIGFYLGEADRLEAGVVSICGIHV